MQFRASLAFLSRLDLLCKKPKDGYGSCVKDLCKAFPQNETINDLWIKHARVLDAGDLRILKMRFPNSQQNLGKSEGFRCIIMVNKKSEEVSLIYVYPKKGKYSQNTVSDTDLEILLTKYEAELAAGTVQLVDIRNRLAVLEHVGEEIPAALAVPLLVETPRKKKKTVEEEE